MDGHWLWVWVGRDGIMFVSYCSVTIVLSGFFMLHNPCGVCYGLVCIGFLCRFVPLCERMLTAPISGGVCRCV